MNENNKKKEYNVLNDLTKMEDETINEALDLIEQALSLVDSKQYDGAISYLRKALGLYQQIGRTNEINAVRHKISEIYILKEQQSEELEEQAEIIQEEPEKDLLEKESLEILNLSPEELIEEAEKLIYKEDFDDALDLYDEAIKIYREANKQSEIERVYVLIEKCYDAKAKFLIRPKNEVSKAEKEAIIEEKKKRAEFERDQQLKMYEDLKDKEIKISNQAYELSEKASEFMKVFNFDKASELYNKAQNLFKEIKWEREVQEIQKTIINLKIEKERFLKELEIRKEKKKKEIELETKNSVVIDEKAKEIKEQGEIEKFKKLTEIERIKQEEEEFQSQITELVDEAEKLNLNYDQDKRRAIKENKFLELDTPYPKIIEIYQNIRNMLLERKWTDQARIYSNQIRLYQDKLEKDKKLREIEAQKRERKKEYFVSLKVKKEEEAKSEKLKVAEEKISKEVEDGIFEKQITELVDKTEKMSREYEVKKKKAIKKGQLDFKSPYPDIIEIYIKVRDSLIERGWRAQAEIYTRQIQIYQDKLEKDNKLREIEAQKIQKQKEYDELLKFKKTKAPLATILDKLKLDKEKYKKEFDLEFVQNEVSKMVDEAIKMAREYEFALRRGNYEISCPYPEIVEIYTRVRDMVLENGLEDQAEVYSKQIQLYQNKLKSMQS
ncbi:MAG: hypothetical protein ACFFAH_01005 [Promethearchaeota archaeon]